MNVRCWALWCVAFCGLLGGGLAAEEPVKKLILPGESFLIAGRPAFILLPPAEKRLQPQPWVCYAPTLPGYPDEHEKWMHEQFLAAGVAVAGIDVGEGYGNPQGRDLFTALHRELTEKRGYAPRPCLLGRSRGGLWVTSWACANPDKVAGIAGIYPVFDFRTYPGLEKAAPAYGLTAAALTAQLDELNPIARVPILAKAQVPVFIIHGDDDKVVPLKENSAQFAEHYKAAGVEKLVTLVVAKGQGHNFWEGFFRCQELVDFAIARAKAGAALAATDRPTPRFDLQALAKPPAVYPTEEAAAEGVKSFFYEGPAYKGKPTRVFAYYGVPQAKSVPAGEKLPAMVLIHGGGGTAFDRWVKVWNARGYAAIAMDLCGCVPVGTYGKWKRHDAGGPPGWDASFQQLGDGLEDQWTHQAVSAVALAHSLVRSYPEVDAERIGVTGISWGGYLTSIVAGVDSRFKFAAPVYGCGFLGDNSAWLGSFEKMGRNNAAIWLRQWDPASYLGQAKMPILWVNGTNDFAYPMDSWQKSYRLPQSPRTLCLRIRMPHGHGPAGENPEEIHVMANALLRGGKPLLAVTGQGQTGDETWATFKAEVAVTKAELAFTRDSGKWQDRKWEAAPAELDAATSRVTAKVPADATVFYLNLFDERQCVVSTEHVSR